MKKIYLRQLKNFTSVSFRGVERRGILFFYSRTKMRFFASLRMTKDNQFFRSLYLLLLFSSILLAQNPDGKNVSLHLTPLWNWGDANYSQTTNVFYPNSYSSIANIISEQAGILKYPIAFGIHSQLKIPTTSYLTLTVSYSYNQKFEEQNSTIRVTDYFSQYWNFNGKMHTVSFTISLYNLFSVYQGD